MTDITDLIHLGDDFNPPSDSLSQWINEEKERDVLILNMNYILNEYSKNEYRNN